MNITYIIGNGFDVNLGLKTRYQDFYDYYQNQPSPSEEVKQLKAHIDRNKENWQTWSWLWESIPPILRIPTQLPK